MVTWEEKKTENLLDMAKMKKVEFLSSHLLSKKINTKTSESKEQTKNK